MSHGLTTDLNAFEVLGGNFGNIDVEACSIREPLVQYLASKGARDTHGSGEVRVRMLVEQRETDGGNAAYGTICSSSHGARVD